jgi:hypothetical protein
MKHARLFLMVVGVIVAVPGVAFAYVGPGAGLGALGALVAVVVSVLMAIGIVLYWPFRVLIRRLRATWPSRKGRGAVGG